MTAERGLCVEVSWLGCTVIFFSNSSQVKSRPALFRIQSLKFLASRMLFIKSYS
jgi:hypothetical protein